MEANMDLLLQKMARIPENDRLAHFICILILAAPDGRTWQAGGRVDGLITFERRGERGFGYDPVFYYIPAGRTFAQMTLEEKNRVSHRSRAALAFVEMWPEIERELARRRGERTDAGTRGRGDVGKA